MEKSEWIWMNGEFVAWDDANVHVLSHGLHYGTGVFEGIRCYETDRGPAIFRHREHLERLARSAEMYYLPLGRSVDEIRDATHELIRRNGLQSCYIRPLAFRGYGEMGLYAKDAPVDVMVAVWPWGAYLGEEGKRKGVRAKVSSWRRISPNGTGPACQGIRPVPELDPRQDRVGERRLRRGDPARRGGERLRGLGREHLRRPRGRDRHPAAHGVDPGRDQPQVDHPDRARPRLYGRGTRCGALGALRGGGGLPVGHRRGAGPGARGRRPRPGGGPGEITRVIQAKFEDALHGRAQEYAEWLDLVEQPSKVSG